jgi:hypothetical protein
MCIGYVVSRSYCGKKRCGGKKSCGSSRHNSGSRRRSIHKTIHNGLGGLLRAPHVPLGGFLEVPRRNDHMAVPHIAAHPKALEAQQPLLLPSLLPVLS